MNRGREAVVAAVKEISGRAAAPSRIEAADLAAEAAWRASQWRLSNRVMKPAFRRRKSNRRGAYARERKAGELSAHLASSPSTPGSVSRHRARRKPALRKFQRGDVICKGRA